ncbi:MAG: NusA N-terminal domain-containing protein [Acutalibacteraceae bacterium]
MMEKVENALLAAFRKENNGNENVRIKLDPEKSDVRMFVQLTVVEAVENPLTEIALDEARLHKKKIQLGDIYENEIKTKNFGRIAARRQAGHHSGHPRAGAPDDPRVRGKRRSSSPP